MISSDLKILIGKQIIGMKKINYNILLSNFFLEITTNKGKYELLKINDRKEETLNVIQMIGLIGHKIKDITTHNIGDKTYVDFIYKYRKKECTTSICINTKYIAIKEILW